MKKFYVGVKGIIRDERGYLILLKSEKVHGETVWEVPGGRIDDNEDFEQTLRRELSEELPGITDVKIGDLVGSFRLQKDIDGDTSLVLLYFLVDAILPDTILLSEEHQSYQWISALDDVPEDLNPEIDTFLRKLISSQ